MLKAEEIVAEFKIKNLAEKDLKAVQKEVDNSAKKLTNLEKEAKKAESYLGKIGKGIKETGGAAAGATAATAEKPISTTSNVISGGMVAGLASIPLLGGLFSALAGSLTDVSDKFTSGVQLQKGLLRDFSTFDKTFGKTGEKFIANFDKSFSTLTEQKQLVGGLAGAGVSKEALAGGGASLELLAKAQGVDLKDVLSTQLQTGKGLTNAQISLIEAYKPLLNNIYTADTAYKMITGVIQESEKPLKEAAKSNQSITSGTQAASVEIATSKQSLALMGLEQQNYTNSLKAFRLEVDKQRFNFEKITTTAAGGTVGAVEIAKKAASAYTVQQDTRTEQEKEYARYKATYGEIEAKKKFPGRASGGEVQKGHKYEINEKGQEFFTPSTNGKIIPNKDINKNSASIVMNNTFNISGGAQDIQDQITQALDNVARQIAYTQGLNIP